MVWAHTFKDDTMIGEARGFADQSLAELWICAHRNSRDTDPVWRAFKGYDWHVVKFNDDGSGDYEILF